MVERDLELVLGEDEVRRTVGGDAHRAILLRRSGEWVA
jgi:hypothetical protein